MVFLSLPSLSLYLFHSGAQRRLKAASMIHENDSEKESRDGSTEEDADEEDDKEEEKPSDQQTIPAALEAAVSHPERLPALSFTYW